MKALIALGDSWTAGVGGLDDHEKNPNIDKGYFYWYSQSSLECMTTSKELSASWANKLSNNLGVLPINLGISGGGNRGAVKSLYLNDIPWDDISGGYLIFMLSSIYRFDLFTNNTNYHRSKNLRPFMTIGIPYKDNENEISKWWFNNIHSDELAVNETLLSILEAQNFAELKNLDFYFCFSFDNCYNMLLSNDLSKKIPWEKCITQNTSFFEELAKIQKTPNDFNYYLNLKKSTEYISKCGHPTNKGYDVIANRILNFIKK